MKLPDKVFAPTATLGEIQEYIKERAAHGTACPACRQHVELEEQAITPAMAHVLILLHRQFLRDPIPIHVPTYIAEMQGVSSVTKGGDWAKLRHWGLIEEVPPNPKDPIAKTKKTNWFKMTERGHQFARAEIKLPSTMYLYNHRHLGPVPKCAQVDIKTCLKGKFDYDQLMQVGGYSLI